MLMDGNVCMNIYMRVYVRVGVCAALVQIYKYSAVWVFKSLFFAKN